MKSSLTRRDEGERLARRDLRQPGLPHATTLVGQVERGQRSISQHNILKLADGLELDPGHLVAGLRGPHAGPA